MCETQHTPCLYVWPDYLLCLRLLDRETVYILLVTLNGQIHLGINFLVPGVFSLIFFVLSNSWSPTL
jgi:hypothetical protein